MKQKSEKNGECLSRWFRNNTAAFTVIEVLIALLVLAIGLIGIASLHLAGLRNAHSSYYTTIASSVAFDFEERMWIAMTDVDEGCLEQADIEAIIQALEGDWAGAAVGEIRVPGLDVDLVSFSTDRLNVDSDFDYWVEARITIGWEDQRFGQGNQESFPYTARVVCAAEETT